MALTVAYNHERFKLNPSGPAIGIDLGTTNSRVGYFINNNVEIITTASDSKRLIGLNYDDNVVNQNKSFWTFNVTKSDNNRPIYDIVKNHQVSPEEVSSEILKELLKMAQDKIGTEKIKSAVITVPAYFDQNQKEATIHAAKLAGIENVKQLITEPTAAAFAYGFDHKCFDGYNLFVFDHGGGTCDVSIVKVEKSEFKVIGHAGDTQLGGRDYDYRLMQYFDQKYKKLQVFESTDEISTKRKMRLREACEYLKMSLSHPAKVSETIDLDDVAPGLPEEDLTYKQFKEIVANLTRRCQKLCFDALEETELKADDIDEVLLVGGSSKMRFIRDMLKDVFPNKELSEAINPDEAVAYGATLRAAQLLDPEKSKVSGIVKHLAIGIGVVTDYILPKKITAVSKIDAVGIDLGTSRCCAAVSRKNGIETVPLDNKGERLLPSFVAYDEEHIKCGQVVIDRLRNYSKSTIFDSKRIIGKNINEIEIDQFWPFKISNLSEKILMGVTSVKEEIFVSAEEVATALLKFIKEKSEAFQGKPLTKAVITVPANFADTQKNSTLNAAKLAGFENVMILSEPVAASFAYFVDREIPNNSNILLFDLGGGTLDVCIFRIVDYQIKIICNGGDTKLGGRDFDTL
uniref:Heat shock protein 70 n=1 Tax=Panagrolaimus davidi TaxID=227884 RepID=A0A914QWP9_9BILA